VRLALSLSMSLSPEIVSSGLFYMRTILTLFITVLFFSCKVTEQTIPGTYRLKNSSKTKLVLNPDKTFEFVKNFSEPGPVFFPDSNDLNFRTTGNWQWDKTGKVILTSFPGISSFTQQATDSISYNTDITSFSFWDQYGDPVPIRFIRFPENRTKLHKSHVISFFAEDFVGSDTMEFHFYGYAPYRWINPPVQKGINNRHKIILYEQIRKGFFTNLVLATERKKLIAPDKSFSLHKSK